MDRQSNDKKGTGPLVSIIMPAWRAYKFIDRAMQSVADQSLEEPFELIVVEDGSDDKNRTWDKIKGWERIFSTHKFLTMKSIQLPVNCGPGHARMIGVENSSAPYICYLDADDELYPARILGALRVFEQTPQADVVLSKYIIEEEGKRACYDPNYVVGRVHDLLQKQNITIPLGVMHTRGIYNKTNGWPKFIVCGEDGLLWRRMSEAGAKFYACNFIAGIYRARKMGQSRTQRRFDNKQAFAFDARNEKGSHGQYLDGLTDQELSQYFDK